MPNSITIDALRVIDAIDRRGSFAAAASELYRVPSAISYTVQKLEDDLGVEIFDRSGHRAILTPAGKYLLEQGRVLLQATETLAHTTRQVAQGWETRIRIAFNSLLPIDALLPAVADFAKLGMPVDVQILEEVFAGTWDALHFRRADLIVGADDLSRPSGAFRTHPMGEIHFVYAVAQDHPLAAISRPLTSEDIIEFPAAVAADSARRLTPGNAGILQRQQTFTVSNIDQKIRLQEQGLAVGWLPECRIREQLGNGKLVAKEMNQVRQPLPLVIACHDDARGKALRWFWERLCKPEAFQHWLG